MGEPYHFAIQDLSGGHVDGIPANEIKDNELAQLVNWYTYGPKIIRRGPATPVTAAPYAEQVIDLFQYKKTDDTLKVLGSSLTGFVKLDGNAWAFVPSPVMQYVGVSGFWVQYINVAYYVRDGNSLLRGDDAGMIAAGIVAPTAAPVLADNGAGIMEAGTFTVVYRYRNSRTGALSKWSAAASITLLVNHKIGVTMLASPAGQVDQIEILMTTPGGAAGTYFRVAYVSASTLTYEINIKQTSLDLVQAVDTNDLPPANLICIAVWDERGWATDGTDLFYTPRDQNSQTALMESWPPGNTISVFPDDGHKIRGIISSSVMSTNINSGSIGRLIIAKTNGMHYVVPNDAGTGYSLKSLDPRIGCTSGHSLKAVMGYLFWFGTGKQFFVSENGGSPISLLSPKIKRILDNIPTDDIDKVVAEVFPELNWYVAIVPQADGPSKVLAFNWQDKSWSVFTHSTSIRYLATVADSNFAQLLYALSDDGTLYRYNDPAGGKEFGDKYQSYFYTKDFDNGKPGNLQTLGRVGLLCSKVGHAPGDAVIGYVKDGRLNTQRQVYLYAASRPDAWIDFVLPGLTNPGNTVGLYFMYQGDEPLELWGYALSGIVLDRMRQPV